MNPLVELSTYKQSYWLDFIRRSLMTSGQLKKLIQNDHLKGITSNPTIFQKALSHGSEYDKALIKAAKGTKTVDEIFEDVAVEDIKLAADILKPVYQSSRGFDGYVSLEVNPNMAFDSEATITEAKKLHKKVNKPNLMVKIPGTIEGLSAIEEATFAGINVNVTLLFSVNVYKKVLDAYLKGLERRVKKGLPIRNIHSVASFFVSRVDSAVNKQLDAMVKNGGAKGKRAQAILHKAAIANAKLSYEHFATTVRSPRYEKLLIKGANSQRLLWASTGTKDSRLSDVVYIEELIGFDTVNTMPPATADAFKDHGIVEPRLHAGLDQAKKDLKELFALGIDINLVTDKLQKEGVQSFIDSYNDLILVVSSKLDQLINKSASRTKISMGHLNSQFKSNLIKMEKENWVKRIWAKEADLWKSDSAHQKIIKNSLGWLTVPRLVQSRLKYLEKITASVKAGKFTHVLLLGMGGSSLCPEVLRLTFGKRTAYPDFSILDSTEPASVAEKRNWSNPEKTLYIVASKSGSTAEPNAFLSYFFNEVKKKKGAKAGENFIAITDPGTLMEKIAKQKKFRHIVLNPPDIGGRYSALSFFGMLPGALMGMNLCDFLNRATLMAGAVSAYTPIQKNPGAQLGAALGAAARAGRNKVTFYTSKDIGSFGTWVEQLIAESTGKESKGILPVESEAMMPADKYGKDRVFISIQTKNGQDQNILRHLSKMEKVGHPVIRIEIDKKEDIGAEFFRWEFATAICGKILNINPFDQPNVQEAKILTVKLMDQFKARGGFPLIKPSIDSEGIQLFSGQAGNGQSLRGVVQSFLGKTKKNDYVALLAFITRNKKNESILQDIREKILDQKKCAATVGFGPRYLHSTGQYHKGGDNHGLFISITANDELDIPIPTQGIKFSALKEAQARGDWGALLNKKRRILHVHLKQGQKMLDQLKKLF